MTKKMKMKKNKNKNRNKTKKSRKSKKDDGDDEEEKKMEKKGGRELKSGLTGTTPRRADKTAHNSRERHSCNGRDVRLSIDKAGKKHGTDESDCQTAGLQRFHRHAAGGKRGGFLLFRRPDLKSASLMPLGSTANMPLL